MSHDLHANLALEGLADYIRHNQKTVFADHEYKSGWSISIGKESGRVWPIADGLIKAAHQSGKQKIHIALEFKSENEGLHGTLTAIGQALAYLNKGYDAAIIVIPDKYKTHDTPYNVIKGILKEHAPDAPINVITYNTTNNNLIHNTPLKLQKLSTNKKGSNEKPIGSTLWAHVREGMSHPDALYKLCKEIKLASSNEEKLKVDFSKDLIDAFNKIQSKNSMIEYLSSTIESHSVLSRAWQAFWYKYIFHDELRDLYKKSNNMYSLNSTDTKILYDPDNGKYQKIFDRNRTSIKQVLVRELNNNNISEEDALVEYLGKVKKEAHSYREVMDSGLFHLNFIDSLGNLTRLGYAFVDEADKGGSVFSPISMQILRGASLLYGNYLLFFHHIHELSEKKFNHDVYSFTKSKSNGHRTFNNKEYRKYLYTKMDQELALILVGTKRTDNVNNREPFQAEIPYLKKLNLINSNDPYRIGLGFCINWPLIHESIDYIKSNNL
ncbi:hypothetical protein HX127_14645 [Acinetobacter sp. 256-1]|uniref:hypothetical protein n=1 Tax=Acinetobacter sp. 256-1 TaxID=2746721 RepID=UPI0025767B65|nr:hypothetical protein [Acinetobacter sp. 256-1]MDM1758772.1 hypothetical protein [Acinetobacter sp. 256-1]